MAVALSAADTTSAGANRPVRVTSVVRSDARTGKLVRSVVVTAKPVAERKVAESVVSPRVVSAALVEPAEPSVFAKPAGVDEAVELIASQQSIPAQLIHSVIKVESNYNPYAVSPKGALGMMQLIPATARRFGVSDVFDPVDNIRGGAKYLKYLLDLYGGNYPLALAAYNAGEAAVAKYGTVPPYAETQNYLKLVARQLEQANKTQAAKPKEKEKEVPPADGKPDAATHVREIVESDGTVRYVSR